MPTLDDRVVLNRHDGLDTVAVTVIDETPVLDWLLIGYANEPALIWLRVPLAWDEADRLTGDSLPLDLSRFLTSMSGRDVLIEVDVGEFTLPLIPATLPAPAIDDLWISETVGEALDTLIREATIDQADADAVLTAIAAA